MERVKFEMSGFPCEGVFRAWGIDFDEWHGLAVHFSAAIIELPSGEVVLIPAKHIAFIKAAPTTGQGV